MAGPASPQAGRARRRCQGPPFTFLPRAFPCSSAPRALGGPADTSASTLRSWADAAGQDRGGNGCRGPARQGRISVPRLTYALLSCTWPGASFLICAWARGADFRRTGLGQGVPVAAAGRGGVAGRQPGLLGPGPLQPPRLGRHLDPGPPEPTHSSRGNSCLGPKCLYFPATHASVGRQPSRSGVEAGGGWGAGCVLGQTTANRLVFCAPGGGEERRLAGPGPQVLRGGASWDSARPPSQAGLVHALVAAQTSCALARRPHAPPPSPGARLGAELG